MLAIAVQSSPAMLPLNGVAHPPPVDDDEESDQVTERKNSTKSEKQRRTALEVGSRVNAFEPSSVGGGCLTSEEVRDRAGGQRLRAGISRSLLDTSLSKTVRSAGRSSHDTNVVAVLVPNPATYGHSFISSCAGAQVAVHERITYY